MPRPAIGRGPGRHGLGGKHIAAAVFRLDQMLSGGAAELRQFLAEPSDDRTDRAVGIGGIGLGGLGDRCRRPYDAGRLGKVLQNAGFERRQRHLGTFRPDQPIIARLQHIIGEADALCCRVDERRLRDRLVSAVGLT